MDLLKTLENPFNVIHCNTAKKRRVVVSNTLNFRLNPKLRSEFLTLCSENDVQPSAVLRAVVSQITKTKRLPIITRQWDEIPETVEAIKELESGGGKSFASVKDLMEDLNG